MSLSRQTLLIRALLAGTLLAMAAGAQAQGLLGYVSGVPTGDALYVAVGNRIETVRYIGIRRPEILHPTRGREPYEEVAREANRQLVEGKWVTLILDDQPRDRYGQLLAYVYVCNQFVNAELAHRGYAEAATYPPNGRYQEYFLGLEQGARAAGRGLWADRSAQAYYRPRPPDEETEVGGTKSFRFFGGTGVGSPGTGGSGSPSPPKAAAPSTAPSGGTYTAPPMRRSR
jgi:endonuclease YncB( thermonuclease family)